MVWFNPSGSFVVGRDEKMLLHVRRIDFDREFLRSPECSESQATRILHSG